MRLDRSDATSLTAIALGGFVGLIGTGLLVERIDDAFDDDVRVEQILDNRITIDGQTLRSAIEIRRDRQPIRVRVDGASPFDLPRTPAIYIDGVRIDADVMSIEDLDPTDIEHIDVVRGPGRPDAGEIHIRMKPR